MEPLTSRKEEGRFIGILSYCRYMWESCLRTLASLTNITPSKVKFKWNKIKQDSFYEIKWIAARNTLLAYPEFNE